MEIFPSVFLAPDVKPLSVMDPPPSQNLQFLQQFLSQVLSQRGPSALPYSEDVKWLIRQHLVTLIETYPSLQPKTAAFTHSDGRTLNLLQADGTIPMFYQNVTYNIPIVIWLMDMYPRQPPCAYVVPTPEMVIKNPHPHVSPSGLVAIPYLHNWIYPSSNLVDLVRNLSHLFGLDPPLYTRPTFPNRNTNHSSSHESNSSSYTPPPPPSSSSSTRSRHHAIPPWSYPPPGSPSPFPPYGSGEHSQSHFMQQHQPADDPTEVYRKNAINKLVEILHGDIEVMRKKREAEMEGLFRVQAVLRQRREDQLSKGLKEMQDEKEGLEQQLQMVLMNTDVLEAWLRENEGKKPITNHGSEEVDEVFEPCDAFSKQMLDCTSSDLAIEDVIFSLDKAVQEGSISIDQYLKNVRSLSRQQFFHRATSSKVRAAQMQAQVSSMAARAHYVM